jgi:glucokinase
LTYTLVADIGGTGSRLARLRDGRLIEAAATYSNREFSAFSSVLESFLAGHPTLPAQMALAVAGPVHNQSVTMTNLGWTICAEDLAESFRIPRVVIVNDFAAIAWATIGMNAADLFQVGGGTPLAKANRGVIGPGTGLGVSGLIAAGDNWEALTGEGGHVTLAATDPEEASLFARVAAEFGHCSAERLISGPGLARIYMLVAGAKLPPEDITQRAQAGDVAAMHAVELFCRLLGTVTANLALTLGAQGGIYLAGGILPAIKELFAASGFRERFEAKGRFANYLAAIPTYIVTRPTPSFVGLDIYLQRLKTRSR